MREKNLLAVEMEAAALYAFAQVRQKPVLCFAHVTNQMGRIDGDFDLSGIRVEPLTVIHGQLPVTAYRIGSFAYVTDCNRIPDESCERLSQLDLLVIDALRLRPHPTHMSLDQSLGYIERLKPRRALLTHISHDIKHAETSEQLPDGVEIAYDGLTAEVG